MILYKSDFANFKQCPKRLWLTKFNPGEDEANNIATYLAERGRIVGNAAKTWAKQFIPSTKPQTTFEFLRNSGRNSIEHTLEQLEQGTSLLYESAFITNEVYSRTDLLWNISNHQIVGEVKSSTSIKDEDDAIKKYRLDLAVQLYAMSSARAAGNLNLEAFQLIVPDSDISTSGIDGLKFKRIDMLHPATEMQEEVASLADQMQEILAGPYEPKINMGPQCKQYGGCPFQNICKQGNFDLLAFELPGFNQNWRKLPELANKLAKKDYPLALQTPIKELAELLLEVDVWKRVHKAEITLQPILDQTKAASILSGLEGPFGYIDFEFASFPYIPAPGMQLGKRIPFQYVLYKRDKPLTPAGNPVHFLNLDQDDPRRLFAESLIKDCQGLKTIFVYFKGAEGGTIKELAEAFPDLSEQLNDIALCFSDLLEIVRATYYHPDMLGSFSLKSVLPTIGLSYADLAIQGGNDAQLQYLYARNSPNQLRVPLEETKQHLKDYCGLDTSGMILLHDFLITGKGAIPAKPIELRGGKSMKTRPNTELRVVKGKLKEGPVISKGQMIGIVAAIILIWAVLAPFIYHFFGLPGSSAELGDSFGVANSLFSALALAGIILSILLQQHDLRLTRNEVAESAKAQKESARALEKQAELLIITTKIQALSTLIASANAQIDQNDGWNLVSGNKKYDNDKLFQKRRQAETELWKLKEDLGLFKIREVDFYEEELTEIL